MTDPAHVRAVRNNNPGNIDRGQPWQGLMPVADMTPEQKAEPRFCVFQTPAWGFRAMAEILRSYHTFFVNHGEYFCIETVIARWAPPAENNTAAYEAHVCQLTGYKSADPLPMDFIHIGALCKAISTHEVGLWAFNDADLSQGLRLAGF